MKNNHQAEMWSKEFGKEYTDRNPQTWAEMDSFYTREFGISRLTLNREFLDGLDREIKILEVGANVGSQLQGLQAMGFQNLYGVELQQYAVEIAKERTKHVNIIQGNALDLPFKDGYFDLVYTSGVLIHISPENLSQVMGEMVRCSKRYIWGCEYFAEKYVNVPYRGNTNLLWKGDFAKIFREKNPGLKLLKEKHFKYLANDNVDFMYLLEKSQ